MLARCNATRRMFLTHTRVASRYTIRLAVGAPGITADNLRETWATIRLQATTDPHSRPTGGMMTTTADARLRRRFQMLDLDGSGVLEATDFSQLAHRVTAAVGADPAAPKAQALLAGTARYWEGVCKDADANHNGQVTLDEYMAAVYDADIFERYVRTYVETQTALVDVNDDGYVERADFIACLQAVGFADAEAASIHAQLDTDNTGRVANEAFVESIAQFYTSDHEVEFDRAT